MLITVVYMFGALIVLVAVRPSITGIITSIKITSYVPGSEAGMNAHLAKPLDDKIIKKTICEELGSSRDM